LQFCTGFWGRFSFLGRPQELVAGVAGRRFVLPFAGESSGKRLTKRNEAQQQLPSMKLRFAEISIEKE
jgi:hypothetical protein